MTFEYPTDDEPISDQWWAPLLAVEARMGESDGSYRRLESLEEGIDGVGLRELPRFRPDRGMTSLDRRVSGLGGLVLALH